MHFFKHPKSDSICAFSLLVLELLLLSKSSSLICYEEAEGCTHVHATFCLLGSQLVCSELQSISLSSPLYLSVA